MPCALSGALLKSMLLVVAKCLPLNCLFDKTSKFRSPVCQIWRRLQDPSSSGWLRRPLYRIKCVASLKRSFLVEPTEQIEHLQTELHDLQGCALRAARARNVLLLAWALTKQSIVQIDSLGALSFPRCRIVNNSRQSHSRPSEKRASFSEPPQLASHLKSKPQVPKIGLKRQ